MLRIWKWYQSCLALHPVKTQVLSSGFLWGFGDITAQYITHSTAKKRLQYEDAENDFKIDWKRVAITGTFGAGFVGPIGHYWYHWLDRFIKVRLLLRPKSASFVAAKVAMDGFIIAPIHLLAFFSYMGLSSGKTVAQVKEDMKRDFLPAIVLEGGVWPIFQVANFRYVPVNCQLLYVNVLCVLDSAFLSWLEQQEDAPWKKRLSLTRNEKATDHNSLPQKIN